MTLGGEAVSRNPMMQLGGLLGDWPDDGDMQFVQRLLEVRVDGRSARLTCLTNAGETCTVVLTACARDVLRLTLVPQGEALERSSLMLVTDELEAVALAVEEDPKGIRVGFGDLAAEIDKEPWELRVYNGEGRLVVGEHRADTNLRGWRRTTWLGYARDASGHVSRTYEAFALRQDEHIGGLGEKFMPLDKRGRRIESWNWNTWGASNERAYKNVPFYVSSAGYGCFLNTTHRIQWDFGSGQSSSISLDFQTEDPRLDIFLIYGPEFAAILDRYTALTGRPGVPPRWSFGLWMSYVSYRSWDEVEDVARELRQRAIPADVIHIDPGWLRPGMFADLQWDLDRFPEPAEHLAKLREQGFRVCLWIQPWIPEDSDVFPEAAANGYFARDTQGAIYWYVPTVPGNPPRRCGIVDFTNPETQRWYAGRLQRLIEQGVAAFKTDFGEAISEDAIFANGMTGRELHNAYPLLYNACVYSAFEQAGAEPLVWGRSGWAGIQRYPVSWSGDQLCNFEAMVCTLWGGLSFSLSGGAFWSHDIGGFEGQPDAELYIRWAQWGLLSSHARAHGTTRREPWHFGEQAERIFREFAQLRYRLIPYLYSCAHEAALTGMPVLRPLVLLDREDPSAWAADMQYLLGPDLLVCPVTTAGGSSQRVYLPKGRWYDFWTRDVVNGGVWIDVPVTLERLPLYVRAGSILPFDPEPQVYADADGRAESVLRHPGGMQRFEFRDGRLTISGDAPPPP
jgi:alpha-D-xyloside xylohydrolase